MNNTPFRVPLSSFILLLFLSLFAFGYINILCLPLGVYFAYFENLNLTFPAKRSILSLCYTKLNHKRNSTWPLTYYSATKSPSSTPSTTLHQNISTALRLSNSQHNNTTRFGWALRQLLQSLFTSIITTTTLLGHVFSVIVCPAISGNWRLCKSTTYSSIALQTKDSQTNNISYCSKTFANSQPNYVSRSGTTTSLPPASSLSNAAPALQSHSHGQDALHQHLFPPTYTHVPSRGVKL